MAIDTTSDVSMRGAARAGGMRLGMTNWAALVPPLLVAAGALTVIVGSYRTWATFYAGLVERDGVAGHGKFFIGLALAAVLAVALSALPGVSRALRWLPLAAGATIAAVALRDLRNLNAGR